MSKTDKKNKAKFTPGPWVFNGQRVENSRYKTMGWLISLYDDGRQAPVATTYNDSQKDEANAHLIAAAPDFCREVSNAVGFWKKVRHDFSLASGDVKNTSASHYIEQMDIYLARLENVLAKARGES